MNNSRPHRLFFVFFLISFLAAGCGGSSSDPKPVANISVTALANTIITGETLQLTAVPRDAAGNSLSNRLVEWSSDSPEIASVNPLGLVTASSPGSVTIFARSEGKTGQLTLTIRPVPVAKVEISPEVVTLQVGQAAQLEAVPLDATDNPLPDREVQWSSSEPTIASVSSDGFVTAIVPGVLTVTATSEGISENATITVVPIPVASVVISPSTVELEVEEVTTLSVSLLDVLGRETSGHDVSWSSSNEAIAIVSQQGVVTATSPGEVMITATSDGKSGQTSILVTAIRFLAITAGGPHTCALSRRGRAYCWGLNSTGQLGTGQGEESPMPIKVEGGHRFTDIVAGEFFTCALESSGNVFCWGSAGSSSVPELVSEDIDFRYLAANGSHICGISSDGRAYCWGRNGYGQLGDGSLNDRASPTIVQGNLTFETISVGRRHTCGTVVSGESYCWGDNTFGQLGDGSNAPQRQPSLVQTNALFVQISLQEINSCGVTLDGALFCWGAGSGNLPARLSTNILFREVSSWWGHTCGVSMDDHVYCWGSNSNGQLGDGTFVDRSEPTLIVGEHNVMNVATGGGFVTTSSGSHSCGIKVDGTALCWGWNAVGQLGTGSFNDSAVPVEVILP